MIVSLNEWNDIAWSPQLELFVAVAETGDNRVMTSTDGIIWTDKLYHYIYGKVWNGAN